MSGDMYEEETSSRRDLMKYGGLGAFGILGAGGAVSVTNDGGGGGVPPEEENLEEGESNLTVASVNSPEYIDTDEDLVVTAEIENTGDADGTGTVEFSVDGGTRSSTFVDVEAGGTQDVQFTYKTDETGSFSPTVEIADSSGSSQTEAQDPNLNTTSIGGISDEVVEGEDEDVEVTVENTSDLTAEQTVVLEANTDEDPRDVGSQSISVEGGSTGSVTFTWTPQVTDTQLESGGVTQDVDVLKAGEISVTEMTVGEAVKTEETSIDYIVENPGDVEKTGSVELLVDGESVSSEDVTIAPSETTEGTFTWTPQSVGEKTLKISADDSEEKTVNVEPNGTVDNSIPQKVEVTDHEYKGDYSVDVTLKNTQGSKLTVIVDLENKNTEGNTFDATESVEVDTNKTEKVSLRAKATNTVASYDIKVESAED